MTSLIMRAHLRQALRPATCPLLYRGPNTRRTLLTLKETLVCARSYHILILITFLDQYMCTV